MNNHEIPESTCETPLAADRRSLSGYTKPDSSVRTDVDHPETQRKMSTNPQTTAEPSSTAQQTTPPTEIAARRGTDPWAAPGETPANPSSRVQRQFEPTARSRLKNLVDKENAYCE